MSTVVLQLHSRIVLGNSSIMVENRHEFTNMSWYDNMR